MPDLDLEPHEYRRKGDWIVRHLNAETFKWWVTAAGIGCVAFIWAVGTLFPSVPWWLAWGIGLAPGIAIILAYEFLQGTRVKLSTAAESQAAALAEPRSLRGSYREVPKARTAGATSRAELPKAPQDRSSSR